jgi:hypothetical protein
MMIDMQATSENQILSTINTQKNFLFIGSILTYIPNRQLLPLCLCLQFFHFGPSGQNQLGDIVVMDLAIIMLVAAIMIAIAFKLKQLIVIEHILATLLRNLVLKSLNIIACSNVTVYYEPRQSSWHVLSKKWSTTIHVEHYHVYNHKLYDAALYAERARQLHEFWWRRQKCNAIIIL